MFLVTYIDIHSPIDVQLYMHEEAFKLQATQHLVTGVWAHEGGVPHIQVFSKTVPVQEGYRQRTWRKEGVSLL